MSYTIADSGHDSITLKKEGDLPVPDGQETTLGEITASSEEWLDMVAGILSILPGKRTADGTQYLLGPVGSNPDLIGSVIAARLRKNQN
ncbi:hypothetical protein [Pseudarthrobacter sp. PS3-L1]|uniref:hypothetical protein n=1 Tax=Pseudarthrobacter sp. PS3-L1 TaxID=3046207 RepID=UPI0024B91767|nr:hypothetical protein [Pseudarthrobacter sp. PS3-L1]MDJ0318942.1 hypothetical protein [Pseudarthrobacter sp. PS3-L1]